MRLGTGYETKKLLSRLSDFLCGGRGDCAEDILDDTQLAYNDGLIDDEVYDRIMCELECFL